MKPGFGSMLVEWRATRRLSQLDLALSTDISQKHISFVELGRAQPSRDMVLKLASGLDMPLRARNELLLSAGYAPHYPERQLELTEMQAAREALELILRHHEPYPAIVTDLRWNIVMRNEAAARLIAIFIKPDPAKSREDAGVNFMRLMFSPDGLRPYIANWGYTRAALLGRLRREAHANPGSPSHMLLGDLGGDHSKNADDELNDNSPLDPVLSLELVVDRRRLRLFSAFTTFGTPQDITLQELRIDLSFPADTATREFLVAAAHGGTSLKRDVLT
jgi:transcriptional regulator with XRE-family HTH domain